MNYKAYLETIIWKNKRDDRLKLDGWRCQKCGSSINLNVHHISYKRFPFEPLEDLVTLCCDCHKTLHRLPPDD